MCTSIAEGIGLSRTYKMGEARVEALRGVDISVEDGEFLGIVGPSGSGKSTLLNILGCLERPTTGSYRLAGQDTSFLSDRELSHIRATKLGFVFQTFNLIAQCTVLENVALPFLYRAGVVGDSTDRSEKAIDRVGLWARRHHRPQELSGGEMQRAAIARALVMEPLLMLADEPTGNLDSKTGESILRLFGELNQGGTTVVVVTHESGVASCCDRIVHLSDGLIVGDGGES